MSPEKDIDRFTFIYHDHSCSSQLLWSSSLSSPCSAIFRKASSQPCRVFLTGVMMISSCFTFSSTSSLRPLCSSKSFGIRMPCELPICIIRVLITLPFTPVLCVSQLVIINFLVQIGAVDVQILGRLTYIPFVVFERLQNVLALHTFS